jgi:hypothetical protein
MHPTRHQGAPAASLRPGNSLVWLPLHRQLYCVTCTLSNVEVLSRPSLL